MGMLTPQVAGANGNAGQSSPARKFGTFGGVFTPSILTILGVIMFMRAGFIVGQSGIFNALLILVIAKSISVLTAFSISAMATNTDVRGGGAYFLISRSLGPEFGGSIGLAFYCAQALSVPFYVIGFSEALIQTLNLFGAKLAWLKVVAGFLSTGSLYVNFAVLGGLFIVTYVGADWAIKTQYVIMAILALSIATFLGGAWLAFDKHLLVANWSAAYTGPDINFWKTFAIYFPAVTGIMAGVNMSGDLKNPSRSIPAGTFAAVIVGAVVYAAEIVLVGGSTLRGDLVGAPYQSLMSRAAFGMSFMVALGVFAATLSSAIGSFLGAPRILQALAQDDIIRPVRFFGKTSQGEPRRALWLTLVIGALVIWYAGRSSGSDALNMIASFVTMLFLCTYGITNLAAFVESFGANPSFRPRFKLFHWVLALAGAVGCICTALLIDAKATIGAVAVIWLLFMYVRKFVLKTSFGDARRGFVYSRIREYLLRLATMPVHPKNWRPTTLVLTGNPNSRLTLVKYALWMGSGRGIVVLVSFLVGQMQRLIGERENALRSLNEFIEQHKVLAFPQVVAAPDFDSGLDQLFQTTGIGPLRPNMVVLGFPGDPARASGFIRHLNTAQAMGMSQIVIHDGGVPNLKKRKQRTMDIWWRGKSNGSLVVILAYLISRNREWSGAQIRILRLVQNKVATATAQAELDELVRSARMDAKTIIVKADKPFAEILKQYSSGTATVFLGFRIPGEEDAVVFQQGMAALLEGMPTTLLVHSTGEADLSQ